MIVAAHQPNFLPWLGFFDKMKRADLFVVVDHVQFERHNFQNRTRIKTAAGPIWLTVPVVQRSRDERIVDKTVDNSKGGAHRWSRKMAMTLRSVYASAPHSGLYLDALIALLERDWERLTDLNIALIEFCRGALGITTPMVRSSGLDIPGMKSEMVLNLCKKVGADVYLSGTGGCKDYLDTEMMAREGVRVAWQEFSHPNYKQFPRGAGFVERLSAIDLLFNCGESSRTMLQNPPIKERPAYV